MDFSINVILEVLRPYRITEHLDEHTRKFRWTALLPERGEPCSTANLYVCMLSELMKRNEGIEGCIFVCIRDRFLDEECEAELRDVVIVNENWELSRLYSLLQSRFLQLQDWCDEMQLHLINRCGYQALVDACEPILKEALYVLDSSYVLLANTKNIRSQDPINTSLTENGYHTDAFLKFLKDQNRLDVYQMSQGNILRRVNSGFSEFDTISRWIKYEGELQIHVVLVCCHSAATPVLEELFNVAMDYFRLCFMRLREDDSGDTRPCDKLIEDILNDRLSLSYLIEDRAKAAGFPSRGMFNVLRLAFENNALVRLRRACQKARTLIPAACVVTKENDIVILSHYELEEDPRAVTRERIQLLKDSLKETDLVFGISLCFEELDKLKDAVAQARNACDFGEKLRKGSPGLKNCPAVWRELFPSSDSIYEYDELYPAVMVFHFYETREKRLRSTTAVRALKKLKEYDDSHGTMLLEILLCYLLHERRPSEASEVLHMHRNNLMYNVKKITDMVPLDLEKPLVRYQLIAGYLLLGAEAANSRDD
ncbi:MAG: PucR family transcriptional regulator [Oscillospiraceae bacterium]